MPSQVAASLLRSSESMLPHIKRVRFRQGRPNRQWSAVTSRTRRSRANRRNCGSHQSSEDLGFSQIQGSRKRWKRPMSHSTLRTMRLARSTFSRCELVRPHVRPHGSEADLSRPVQKRLEEKVPHGGAKQHPRQRPLLASERTVRRLTRRVMSPHSPCSRSHSRAATPAFRKALATTPLPLQKSAQYRPCITRVLLTAAGHFPDRGSVPRQVPRFC